MAWRYVRRLPSRFRLLLLFSAVTVSLLIPSSGYGAGLEFGPADGTAKGNAPWQSEVGTAPVSMHENVKPKVLDLETGLHMSIAVAGTTLDAPTRQMLAYVRPGVVILMGPNVENEAQVTALVKSIKEAVGHHTGIADWPLIAVDQEGGRVNRLRLPKAPAAQVLGAEGSFDLIRDTAQYYARECAKRGIAITFAPVMDIATPGGNSVIGDRAFGSDGTLVAQAGMTFAQGVMQEGVLPVVKHFPGHGSTKEDSHTRLAVLPLTGIDLQESLAPFVQAVQCNAPAIMVGHIACPELDPSGVPASLSSTMLRGLLREQLGYDGLVITDDMNMGAIGMPVEDAVVQALAAGNDMVLFCDPNLERIRAVKRRIEDAMATGALDSGALLESERRITRLQGWLRESEVLRFAPGTSSSRPLPETSPEVVAPLAKPTAGPFPTETEDVGVDRQLIHTVKKNDTLDGIAKKYGTSTKAIKQANALKDDKIKLEQRLIIPKP